MKSRLPTTAHATECCGGWVPETSGVEISVEGCALKGLGCWTNVGATSSFGFGDCRPLAVGAPLRSFQPSQKTNARTTSPANNPVVRRSGTASFHAAAFHANDVGTRIQPPRSALAQSDERANWRLICWQLAMLLAQRYLGCCCPPTVSTKLCGVFRLSSPARSPFAGIFFPRGTAKPVRLECGTTISECFVAALSSLLPGSEKSSSLAACLTSSLLTDDRPWAYANTKDP